MVEPDLEDKVLKRGRDVHKVVIVARAVVHFAVIQLIDQALHVPLKLLLGHDLLDLRGHGRHLCGDAALMLAQAVGAALIEGHAVLPDDEGLDLTALEDGLLQVLVHAEVAVGHVKEELRVQPAEVDPLGLLKLLAEHVVFVPEDHVLLEFFDGHGVDHLVRQVHEAVAVVTDLFPADLPGQQALDFPAANGAGRAFCK